MEVEEKDVTAEIEEETQGTAAEDTEVSAEKETKEEAKVPSYRLREETEKRKAVEEENLRLRADLEGARRKPAVNVDTSDLKQVFKKRLKPVFNQDTGEWEVSDDSLAAMVELSGKISHATVKPIYDRLAQSEVKSQKSELKTLPHFKELEKEVDEMLDKMPTEQRMMEGSVKAAYKYLLGEKVIRDNETKSNTRPKVDGDILPNKSGGGNQATSQPKKLSDGQRVEFEKTWQGKGFDEQDYLDLFNRMKKQDEGKGFKTKRELIGQTINS